MFKIDLNKIAEEIAERIVDEILETDCTSLLKLLEAKSKKDAMRIGDDLTVSKSQFSGFILNVYVKQINGYCYKPYFKDYVAADLSKDKLDEYIKNGKIGKIINKTFLEGKHNCFHFFVRDSEWHLFYFDSSDLRGDHWEKGEHIHYISYLWGIDRNKVLSQVGNRKYNIGGMHIRTLFE